MGVLRLLLTPTSLRVLRPRFGADEAERILAAAFSDYRSQLPTIPREVNAGARLMVRGAALTVGLYRALLKEGLSDQEARTTTAVVTGAVYEKMSSLPWAIARVTKRSSFSRLKRATDLFRRFPFGPPSYEMVDVPSDSDVVAFDVLRCPVASYLRSQGLSQLCVEAWCSLDVPLAEKWGSKLERTTTLAEGAPRCDFRWRLSPDPADACSQHHATPSRE